MKFWLFFLWLITETGFAKQGLIVHSYRLDQFWSLGIDKGITSELKSVHRDITFTSFSLEQTPLSKIKEAIMIQKPDFVVLDGDETFSALKTHILSLKIPLFFTALINRKLIDTSDKRYTGVIQVIDINPAFFVLERLLNTTLSSLHIVAGSSPATFSLVDEAIARLQYVRPEVKISRFHFSELDDYKKSIVELEKQNEVKAIVLLLPFQIKHKGQPISWTDAGQFIRSHLHKPTIGVSSCQGPIQRTVSSSISPEYMGRQTALQIHAFLRGKTLDAISVEEFRFRNLEVCRSEVKRLHLSVPESLIYHLAGSEDL